MTYRILLCVLLLGLIASCQRSTTRAPVPAEKAKQTPTAPSVPESIPARTEELPRERIRQVKDAIVADLIDDVAETLYAEAKIAKGETPPPPKPSRIAKRLDAALEPARRVVGEAFGEALAEALTQSIITEGPKSWAFALKANDPLETQLVAVWCGWWMTGYPQIPSTDNFKLKASSGLSKDAKPESKTEQPENPVPDYFTIYLVRPAQVANAPDSLLIVEGDRPWLRFTRVHAPIERPLAIFTRTQMEKGKLSHSEQTLVFGPDGKWKPLESNERKEQPGPLR